LSSTTPGGSTNLLRAQSLAGSLGGVSTICSSGRHSEFQKKQGMNRVQSFFSSVAEAACKDVEREFGVLQSR
jgi:hypothetical protein